MKKKVLLAIVAAAMMLAACGNSAEETTAAATEAAAEETEAAAEEETEAAEAEAAEGEEAAASEEDRVYIGAVAAEAGIPYFTTMSWGAMDAAQDYNVELYWTGPAEWDFSKQQPFIDSVIQTNPDALLLVPTDSDAYISYVEAWMADGLPVICCDATLKEHVDLIGYNSNPYEGGARAAEVFFEMNGPGGVYQPVSTNPGAYGANLRISGFVETMQELDPTCEMLEVLYPTNDANKAAELVSNSIVGNPDMTGIFVATSAPASGAASAVIEAGKQGEIKIAAFDADPQQVQDLKAGIYDVLIAQDPYQMGYDAVMNLAKYVRGEITQEDLDATVTDPEGTPGVRSYNTAVLTRDNVDDPENEHFKYIAELSEVGY